MPTDGKLHNVPCVQFSFSDNNIVLSESVEGMVNVIADSCRLSAFDDYYLRGYSYGSSYLS
jgi:hypothetical protein